MLPRGTERTGGENCCVVTAPMVFAAPRLKRLMPEIFLQAAVVAGKAHLEKDLRLGRRNIHVEQVDDLARGRRDLNRAVGAVEVLHCAAQEDQPVLGTDL